MDENMKGGEEGYANENHDQGATLCQIMNSEIYKCSPILQMNHSPSDSACPVGPCEVSAAH
jgi:hypothetical protein